MRRLSNVTSGSVTPLAVALVAFFATPGASASAVVGENLVANPGFENGLVSWTVSPNATWAEVVSYGDPGVPVPAVSQAIGGSGNLVRVTMFGTTSIEQVVQLPAPSGQNLHVGGYFGGVGMEPDDAGLQVRFLNPSNILVGTVVQLPKVTATTRNFEPVLMLREAIIEIPEGATKAAVRIELTRSCCNPEDMSMADGVFVELVDTPVVPDPVQIGVELLHNPSFDAGWAATSPLRLDDSQSWEGTGERAVLVRQYGDTNAAPVTEVSTIIGGGGSLLGHVDFTGSIHQRIDVRGNLSSATGFNGLALQVSAFLGGARGGEFDPCVNSADMIVRFLKSNGSLAQSSYSLGPITEVMRNFETVVMKRSLNLDIPAETAFVEVEVVMVKDSCEDGALVDNLSVKLIDSVPPQPVQLGKNLIGNGGFESDQALPGSPLELTDPNGWVGNSKSKVQIVVVPYGQSNEVPKATFAFAEGLGSQLATAPGVDNRSLLQTIDLSGSAALIEGGHMSATVTAWLGVGLLELTDMAEVRIQLLTDNGTPVVASKTLGPVSSADLGGQVTVIQKKKSFPIHVGTRSLELELLLTKPFSGPCLGMADGISVVFESDIDPGDLGPANCDSSKVSAVGSYMQRVLKAHAKFVAKDPATQNQAVLDGSVAEAGAKLIAAFAKAAAKAQGVGGTCTYTGSASDIVDSSLAAAESLVNAVTAGADPASSKDRGMRRDILLLAGSFYRDALKAEKANIKQPDADKLVQLRAKYRKSFMKKAAKVVAAAATSGALYTGADLDGVASSIDAEIDAIVNSLH